MGHQDYVGDNEKICHFIAFFPISSTVWKSQRHYGVVFNGQCLGSSKCSYNFFLIRGLF